VAGGNGSGKSTLLKLLAGIIKPQSGRVKKGAKYTAGYLPQQARDYFLRDKVRDEIDWTDAAGVNALAERLRISHLLDGHPFDISGGEQQKAALLSVLSRKPELILLDEPTRAMDPPAKETLAGLLRQSDAAIVIATHDLEFAARHADRCAMLFDGEIVYEAEPRTFFTQNRYYTTAIHKGLRHIDENAVVLQDAYDTWGINPSGQPRIDKNAVALQDVYDIWEINPSGQPQ
jgi:energy-coupling factor transport system ATP-binding protein